MTKVSESDLDALETEEQRALVLRTARALNAAGIDYVLAVGAAGDGHVLSNMCPSCATNLLGAALGGALARADGGHQPHGTLQ